jgi:protoporphyrinogen oxidase
MILGAGMTGLAAGWASGLPVYEAESGPGGICASYYVRPRHEERLAAEPADGEAYRFEIGGGHWIFGGDPILLEFVQRIVPIKRYERLSSVYFPDDGSYVPYPIQNHLSYLPPALVRTALSEIVSPPPGPIHTMAEWLRASFGPSLTERFFGPFHDLYTAGLWQEIGPQDSYKSPVDVQMVVRGAFDRTPAVGYNTTFLYPEGGLDRLARGIAEHCDVRYGKRVIEIDPGRREVRFEDGSSERSEFIISTLPLNRALELSGLSVEARPDPHSSVLVLNLGARKGARCPADHWLYIPQSRSGFHRVGFYSNVDTSFLPRSTRTAADRVSIYVERAFTPDRRPSPADVKAYQQAVADELREWGWIEEVEVSDPTWIEVAYTWSWPHSRWVSSAIQRLESHGIYQAGRYARWSFQGIAASIKEGFVIGSALRPRS